MKVCERCARLGTEVVAQTGPRPVTGKAGPGARPTALPVRRKRDVFDFIGEDIVEEYADRIREARLAKGMTQKDLALELKEKEHLIRKIENGDLIPEDSVRKKIEAALEISLVESDGAREDATQAGKTKTTLGDVIQIKRK
jgi:putative transcription factor